MAACLCSNLLRRMDEAVGLHQPHAVGLGGRLPCHLEHGDRAGIHHVVAVGSMSVRIW